mmetsp:Transcript_16115/g.18253  ORF Transcript_16115/g.18253 Transcript_16115/m.18253 type:complete len:248 (-) Transcript_16115:112-855(-)
MKQSLYGSSKTISNVEFPSLTPDISLEHISLTDSAMCCFPSETMPAKLKEVEIPRIKPSTVVNTPSAVSDSKSIAGIESLAVSDLIIWRCKSSSSLISTVKIVPVSASFAVVLSELLDKPLLTFLILYPQSSQPKDSISAFPKYGMSTEAITYSPLPPQVKHFIGVRSKSSKLSWLSRSSKTFSPLRSDSGTLSKAPVETASFLGLNLAGVESVLKLGWSTMSANSFSPLIFPCLPCRSKSKALTRL